ncbi:FCD domain-containing protein [Chelativorans sp. Marseille-P2723]|uniref:FadR/GntR family transcriptional regulator n=1 Tax=Chelativorans sp. Marseille-P2723 TaxID=2709133 RepID=UPI001AEF33E9|nr:FCD domain-containing protein [Chelativorans sp. Marseille-P2723]
MKTTKNFFEPVVTEPAYRAVARMIESKILAGEVKIGEPLPSEAALADQFGVHRSTVREAIRSLEQAGLVARRRGQKRLYTTKPGSAQISRRVSTAMLLGKVTFHELWEVMLYLEVAAVNAALDRLTDDILTKIEENVIESELAVSEGRSTVLLDVEFHFLLAQAAGNRALLLCREPISQLFYPAFQSVMARLNAGERMITAHRKIFEALRNRDRAMASEWMERHIVDFRRGYELADLDLDTPIHDAMFELPEVR